MNKEYHEPFIKSLVLIACFTIIAIITSRYVAGYYANSFSLPQKTIEYSTIKD